MPKEEKDVGEGSGGAERREAPSARSVWSRLVAAHGGAASSEESRGEISSDDDDSRPRSSRAAGTGAGSDGETAQARRVWEAIRQGGGVDISAGFPTPPSHGRWCELTTCGADSGGGTSVSSSEPHPPNDEPKQTWDTLRAQQGAQD